MGNVTNILMAKRDHASCASQEEVDQRFSSCVYRYELDVDFAREAPGDPEVGALACELTERSLLGNCYFARNAIHNADQLFLYTEKEADDRLLGFIQFHANDVLAKLAVLDEQGIFDLPSP